MDNRQDYAEMSDHPMVMELRRIADALEEANGHAEDEEPVKPRVAKYTPNPGELPSMDVSFERDGKVWEGTLYAVRDIEK